MMEPNKRGGQVAWRWSFKQLHPAGSYLRVGLVVYDQYALFDNTLACFSCMGQCFLALLVTRTVFSAVELLSSVQSYQTYEI